MFHRGIYTVNNSEVMPLLLPCEPFEGKFVGLSMQCIPSSSYSVELVDDIVYELDDHIRKQIEDLLI